MKIVLKTDKFKESCAIIKNAIDSKNVSLYTETLMLYTENNILYLNITNREYYCRVKFVLDDTIDFKASVNAKLFLDLITKMTSATISLEADGRVVHITGNGYYKVPIIFDNDNMLILPDIKLNNITNSMSINSDILQSILTYNSRELQRGIPRQPVQSYYYIDEHGAITFTSGACVNNFTLEKPVRLLLSEKVVKLFKFFKDTDKVEFAMAQDKVSNDLIQTKVLFKSDVVTLTAILAENSLISTVPVEQIRNIASKNYLYSVILNRDELSSALDRLMLFNSDKNYGRLDFSDTNLYISDWSGENKEKVTIQNKLNISDNYSAILNMNTLNLILTGCKDEYITMCFGDSKAFVIKKQNIIDVIPELREN